MNINLQQLSVAAELFKKLNTGTHLNHHVDNELWFALEKYTEQYTALFKTIGFDLMVDSRGFAYFKTEQSSSNVNKLTHQLALIMLVIFEHKADSGAALYQFEHWHIDKELIEQLWKKHQSLLEAEEINNLTAFTEVFERGCRVGFLSYENNYYRLLTACYRYLDLFEELQKTAQEKTETDEN